MQSNAVLLVYNAEAPASFELAVKLARALLLPADIDVRRPFALVGYEVVLENRTSRSRCGPTPLCWSTGRQSGTSVFLCFDISTVLLLL